MRPGTVGERRRAETNRSVERAGARPVVRTCREGEERERQKNLEIDPLLAGGSASGQTTNWSAKLNPYLIANDSLSTAHTTCPSTGGLDLHHLPDALCLDARRPCPMNLESIQLRRDPYLPFLFCSVPLRSSQGQRGGSAGQADPGHRHHVDPRLMLETKSNEMLGDDVPHPAIPSPPSGPSQR